VFSIGQYKTYETIPAKNDSTQGFNLSMLAEFSRQITSVIGILGTVSLDGAIGGAFKHIGTSHQLSAIFGIGPFIYKNNYRVYTLVGVGASKLGFLGYPGLISELLKKETVSALKDQEILNSRSAFIFQASIGVDYKFDNNLCIGAYYTYDTAFGNAIINDTEKFTTSLHSLGVRIGLHI
jgi:opacity protein-like surface antigen